jgi:hypothetical protein
VSTLPGRANGAAALPDSGEETARRVAVLRRFRELLRTQRDRFARYLEVLDAQKEVIQNGSVEDLTVHVEMEEHIVADIFAIQKVIDPLEAMYHTLSSGAAQAADEERELPGLKTSLERLKTEAVARTERNKNLLNQRMEELRLELKTLRSNPYAIHRSVYGSESPSLVDISG